MLLGTRNLRDKERTAVGTIIIVAKWVGMGGMRLLTFCNDDHNGEIEMRPFCLASFLETSNF